MRLIDADEIRIKPEYMHNICGSVMIRVEDVARIINEMPTINPQPRWIPCSERPPEKNDVYIVSYEDAVTWLEWFNGKWFFYPSNPAREETGTIIAWMPFPKPYHEEGEEE